MTNLVPDMIGTELVEISERGALALIGTGFDPYNPQHQTGSDAVRYAIAIQQYRDVRAFGAADAARQEAERYFYVMQEARGTRLIALPPRLRASARARRRAAKSARMLVRDGVLYDG